MVYTSVVIISEAVLSSIRFRISRDLWAPIVKPFFAKEAQMHA
jgi:hypothetical protein